MLLLLNIRENLRPVSLPSASTSTFYSGVGGTDLIERTGEDR